MQHCHWILYAPSDNPLCSCRKVIPIAMATSTSWRWSLLLFATLYYSVSLFEKTCLLGPLLRIGYRDIACRRIARQQPNQAIDFERSSTLWKHCLACRKMESFCASGRNVWLVQSSPRDTGKLHLRSSLLLEARCILLPIWIRVPQRWRVVIFMTYQTNLSSGDHLVLVLWLDYLPSTSDESTRSGSTAGFSLCKVNVGLARPQKQA